MDSAYILKLCDLYHGLVKLALFDYQTALNTAKQERPDLAEVLDSIVNIYSTMATMDVSTREQADQFFEYKDMINTLMGQALGPEPDPAVKTFIGGMYNAVSEDVAAIQEDFDERQTEHEVIQQYTEQAAEQALFQRRQHNLQRAKEYWQERMKDPEFVKAHRERFKRYWESVKKDPERYQKALETRRNLGRKQWTKMSPEKKKRKSQQVSKRRRERQLEEFLKRRNII